MTLETPETAEPAAAAKFVWTSRCPPGRFVPRYPERVAVYGPLPEREPMVRDVIAACAAVVGVSVGRLLSGDRHVVIVRPRQCAMWVAFHLTLKSLPEIGRRFGGRDHTTVMHAIAAIERRMKYGGREGEDVAELIAAILKGLGSKPAPGAQTEPALEAPPAPTKPKPQDAPLLVPVARIKQLRRDKGWSVRGIAKFLQLPEAVVALHLGVAGTFAAEARTA